MYRNACLMVPGQPVQERNHEEAGIHLQGIQHRAMFSYLSVSCCSKTFLKVVSCSLVYSSKDPGTSSYDLVSHGH